jgi:predicted secreted hydrolase
MALNLICHNDRAPILQGPGGVNPKGPAPGQASYYYSMTRLPTSGTLTINGKDFTVEGSTWMDHEFSSNALSENQVGWDWMGLRLTDGDDLMIYRLRDKAGQADYLSGTLIHPDGTPQYLAKADIQITGSNPWTSNQTHAIYPQTWNLQVRGLPHMTIHSLMPGQELITGDSTKVSYFEGAAEVQDSTEKPIGEGYLEMTGYAQPLTGNGLGSNTKR